MKKLAIRRQVRLSFARVAEICLHGIYHRLFRSLVTLSIVAVAVAFMMYMLAGSLISRGVQRHAQAEAENCRLYDRWVQWFEEPMDAAALFRLVGGMPDGDLRLRSLETWLSRDGGPPGGFAGLRAAACDGQRLLAAVDDLTPGRRLLLAGEFGDAFLLDALGDAPACERFLQRAAEMGGVRLPGEGAGVRALVARYQAQRPVWAGLAESRNARLGKLLAAVQAASVGELLAAPPPNLGSTLAELGLLDDAAVLRRLLDEARFKAGLVRLAVLLRNTVVRRDVALRAGVSQLNVTLETLARVYLGGGGPACIEASLTRGGIAALPAREATRRLLAEHQRRVRVLRIEAEAAGPREGFLGFSPMTLWLIGVSFVVCVVGIANAMLMSVMERFREIATMKCLGAKDSFVMTLFVMESCVQGVAGGLLGALLGLALAIPMACLRFGALAWSTLPWGAVGLASLLAMAAGVVLAGLASLYPAQVAARLAPMEAMRVE